MMTFRMSRVIISMLIVMLEFELISCDYSSSASKFDRFEVENLKYDLEIEQNLIGEEIYKTKSSGYDGDDKLVPIKASNGQLYVCELPKKTQLDGIDGKIGADEEENEEEEAGFGIWSMFLETSSSLPHQKKTPEPQINFTLVNEQIKSHMSRLNETNLCLQKNLGWWTYEFCFGKSATQYHVKENGSIDGEKINLGNFTTDYDWLKANMSNYPTSSGVLFHEQYFEMGSHCELSGRPRRSTVKIYCDELGSNYIDLISEIESCVYEIHINSYLVCSVPHFRKSPQNFQVSCNPVVHQHVYNQYIEKKSIPLPSTAEQVSQPDQFETKAQSSVESDESKKSKTDESLVSGKYDSVMFDSFDADALSEIFDLDGADDEEQEETYRRLLDNLMRGKKVLDELKTDAKTFETNIDNLKRQTSDKSDTSKTKEELLESLKNFKSKKEKLKHVLGSFADLVKDDVASPEKDSSDERDTSSERETSIERESSSESKEATKKDDEEELSEKLAKKFKIGKNVKVKIITLGGDAESLKGLNNENSNSIAELLGSLLENRDSDRIKQLKNNYDSVYTENSIDELVHTQKKEKSKTPDRSRQSSDFLFSIIGELDSGEADEESDTADKSILF